MSDAFKRFALAKASMPAPKKDTAGYNYKYATLGQVRGIVCPALHEHGLTDVQYMKNGMLFTEIADEETGDVVLTDVRPTLQHGTDQQRGSSETYQRRYALLTVCGLAPEDDDGAAANSAAAYQEQPWQQ